ncbi:hypothetical protein OHA25_54285 [Nonomuraea sp. NBC_00507]
MKAPDAAHNPAEQASGIGSAMSPGSSGLGETTGKGAETDVGKDDGSDET